MTTEKQRIEFIDLAKGICILLVVLGHLVPEFNDNVTFVFCFRMPLYFCLSGLFYKDYGSIKEFLRRKTNKILIPFAAWYLIGYGIYYAGRMAGPSQSQDAIYHLTDLLISNDIFNIPIWFLLCLFWSNVIFALVKHYITNVYGGGVCILALCGCGWAMQYFEVFNFLYFGSALTCMPFFYMGYALKRTTILSDNSQRWRDLVLMILALGCGLLLALLPDMPPRLTYFKNTVSAGNPATIYSCAALLVVGILLLCKFIGHIPYVSWLGRYSIIVLVTHMPLSAVTGTILSRFIGPHVSEHGLHAINFMVIILLMAAIIPICKRYLPHITAQKDVIK